MGVIKRCLILLCFLGAFFSHGMVSGSRAKARAVRR